MAPTSQPLIISEALSHAGLGKSIVLLVSAAVGVYHWHSILGFFSKIGFISKILGVVALIVVAAASGLIPGVSVEIAVGKLVGAGEAVVDFGRAVVEVAL